MVLIIRNGTYIKKGACQGVQMVTEVLEKWEVSQQVDKGKFGLNLAVLARKPYCLGQTFILLVSDFVGNK